MWHPYNNRIIHYYLYCACIMSDNFVCFCVSKIYIHRCSLIRCVFTGCVKLQSDWEVLTNTKVNCSRYLHNEMFTLLDFLFGGKITNAVVSLVRSIAETFLLLCPCKAIYISHMLFMGCNLLQSKVGVFGLRIYKLE